MSKMPFSVKVNLKNFKLDKTQKSIVKGLQRGIVKAGFHLEGQMKKISPVTTGRYRSSISVKIRKLQAIIGPNVVYAGWIEEGAKSPHAPKSHKASGFRGHKVVTKTIQSHMKKAIGIIEKEIGRSIR